MSGRKAPSRDEVPGGSTFDAEIGSGRLVCRVVSRFLFPRLTLQELDIHFGAVDADQLTAAIGETGGRQEQKELLEVEALDRTVNRQHRIVVGNGVEKTLAAPGAIDTMMQTSWPRPNSTRSSAFLTSLTMAYRYGCKITIDAEQGHAGLCAEIERVHFYNR
jgi:hypothetical protein